MQVDAGVGFAVYERHFQWVLPLLSCGFFCTGDHRLKAEGKKKARRLAGAIRGHVKIHVSGLPQGRGTPAIMTFYEALEE
jgi:hypothetical protein